VVVLLSFPFSLAVVGSTQGGRPNAEETLADMATTDLAATISCSVGSWSDADADADAAVGGGGSDLSRSSVVGTRA